MIWRTGTPARPRGARRLGVAAMLAAGCLVAPAFAAAASGSPSQVYVAARGAGVLTFGANAGGVLSPPLPAVAAGTAPAGVALSPDGSSLYVADAGEGRIRQYDVGVNGTVAAKQPASVAAGRLPFAVTVSPDGRSAYAADLAGGVLQYGVAPDGRLVAKAPAVVAAGLQPVAVAVSPDGASVYVANNADGTLSQFDVAAGGVLVAKAPASVAAGSHPAGVAVSPDGSSVYVTDHGSAPMAFLGSVRQFAVLAGGALVAREPAAVGAGLAPSGIAVAPGGGAIWVANRSGSSVSQYAVDAGGLLVAQPEPTIAAGNEPFALAVAADGTSVYVANIASGDVSQYDVLASGALAPKAPATVLAAGAPVGIAVRARRDDEAPAIEVTAPLDGASYALGARVRAQYRCVDEPGGSGVATCEGDVLPGARLDTSTTGSHRFTVTARDGVGNVATRTVAYRVVYAFTGFRGPLRGEPFVNEVRAGATVKVRFGLGGDQGLGVLAPGAPTSVEVPCDAIGEPAGGGEPAISRSVRGLRYSARRDRYAFDWRTQRVWAGTCRQFMLTLSDGTTHRALLRFMAPAASAEDLVGRLEAE